MEKRTISGNEQNLEFPWQNYTEKDYSKFLLEDIDYIKSKELKNKTSLLRLKNEEQIKIVSKITHLSQKDEKFIKYFTEFASRKPGSGSEIFNKAFQELIKKINSGEPIPKAS